MRVKRSFRCLALLSLLIFVPAAQAAEEAPAVQAGGTLRTIHVNCDTGNRSLQRTIEWLRLIRSLEIVFSGNCTENVTIARDDFTLRGGDNTAAVVGQIKVLGGNRVSLKDFTVRDTPGGETPEGDGIRVLGSTDVTLSGLTIQDTGRRAISIETSSADVINVSVLRTSGNSLIMIGSNVKFGGEILADGTNHAGIHAAFGSSVFINEDTKITSRNAIIGMITQINSTMTVSDGVEITNSDNLFVGLQVSSNSSMFLGLADIVSTGNGGPGILVANHGIMSVFIENSTTLISSDNGGGVWALRNSIVDLTADTTVMNNGGPGIVSKESSIRIGGTTASGNAPDVLLSYMARANFAGNNQLATPVVCDGFVLTEGDDGCPAAKVGVQAPTDFLSVLDAPELRRVYAVAGPTR